VSGIDSRSIPTRRPENPAALSVAAVALAGMAYCHIKDVGMKFEEDVYYMAILFCCNIAISIALIPALIWAERKGSEHAQRLLWGGAAALAAATIAGFVWSRTVGFPQMEDHVGEWDTLGVTSLIFEGTIVLVGALMLSATMHRSPSDRNVRSAAPMR
jgi:peptidoglycan/LPS O-acetylase OafA/YrhL